MQGVYKWILCLDELPKPEEDYISFTHSRDVLVYDGKQVRIGHLQVWEDNEYPPQWRESGRDGYEINGVTHWMPLPEPPGVYTLTDYPGSFAPEGYIEK